MIAKILASLAFVGISAVAATNANAGPLSGGGGFAYYDVMAECSGEFEGQPITAEVHAEIKVTNIIASLETPERVELACHVSDDRVVVCSENSEAGFTLLLSKSPGNEAAAPELILSRGKSSVRLNCQVP